jgi:hypothetical protein
MIDKPLAFHSTPDNESVHYCCSVTALVSILILVKMVLAHVLCPMDGYSA